MEVLRELKTDDILHIDCRTEEGYHKLQKYLLKIPQLKKSYEKQQSGEKELWNLSGIPEEVLERLLHMFCIKKGYQVMNIQPFYGKGHDEFVFYTASAKRIDGHVWIGNVYGKSLYETLAKLIIMIYADIRNPKQESVSNG